MAGVQVVSGGLGDSLSLGVTKVWAPFITYRTRGPRRSLPWQVYYNPILILLLGWLVAIVESLSYSCSDNLHNLLLLMASQQGSCSVGTESLSGEEQRQ